MFEKMRNRLEIFARGNIEKDKKRQSEIKIEKCYEIFYTPPVNNKTSDQIKNNCYKTKNQKQ